jgi:hypothetical protein
VGSSPMRVWSRCWAPPGNSVVWHSLIWWSGLPSAPSPPAVESIGCCVCGPPVRVAPPLTLKKRTTKTTTRHMPVSWPAHTGKHAACAMHM